MSKEIELNSLKGKIQTDINFYHTENVRLQSDYDIGISRIQQLEQNLLMFFIIKRVSWNS